MTGRALVELGDGLDLVLASGSPRRRELLASVGLEFVVRPPDIDERPRGDDPIRYVQRLSREKAVAVARPDEIILAADTTVELEGSILEKPVDRDDARRMLRLLSGRVHRCHTGVTVLTSECGHETFETLVVSTDVAFVALTEPMIDWYLATGEADDKAGAYGIQGAAGAFVEHVDGSVTNVIGLPLAETLGMLRRAVRSGDTVGR
ncbi:MAG: Maf family protein [Ilumatobacter sp.]|jgi:septum formation protein|uniref:Maf family protein n=1 Tax=Ilumatobacter sp. TaxID=1967498 RepID=UPI00391B09AB